MKRIYSSIVLFLVVVSYWAQTPQFWNYNVTGGANAFPFATTTSRKVQWRILANSLGTVTVGNNITVVYFMTGSAASNTYPILNISLKQGPAMFSGGGLYETGMTLVYAGVNVTKAGVANGWMSFTLTTPFTYDPSLPLFVEVEHNATTGAGPTVHQTSPVGPGSGRQYGNYPNPNYTGADATVAHFGIDVVPNTPCSGTPATNTLLPSSFSTCPGISNPNLTFAQNYLFGGINYAWQSSTVSPVGPFTTIPGATLNSAPVPTIGITTWYQAIVTCTNPGGGSTTIPATQFFVAGQVISTVPYYEDFEGLQVNDRLPNCSWWANNLGTTVKSYITSNSGNRVPRSGSKFATFELPSTNNIVYSNGITMSPGITYSAALHYATEYFGYSNWSNLTILVGTSQSPTGLVPIASVSPVISGPYALLSGTFTVPSGGNYYIAVRATGSSGSALYLSWDDLSVTIPCYGPGASNASNVILSVGSTTICEGDQVSINASGADTYLWNTGATTPGIIVNPVTTSTYVVAGTNALTGCVTNVTQVINVTPSPTVFIVASKTEVCPGEPIYLTGYGANAYAWSNSSFGNPITVNPTSSITYSVQGTNLLGCAKSAAVSVSVKQKPTVTALSLNVEICPGEIATLTGQGANTYQWISSSTAALYQGNPLNIPLTTTTTFSVVGTATNGCQASATVLQSVGNCTGFEKLTGNSKSIEYYPNPTHNLVTVKLHSGIIADIEVTDISGRVVMSLTGSSATMDVDLSSLSNGVYYAKINSNENSQVIRLVKN